MCVCIQTQVEVAIAAADGDLNVAVEILMTQQVTTNGENCEIKFNLI